MIFGDLTEDQKKARDKEFAEQYKGYHFALMEMVSNQLVGEVNNG